MKLSFGLKPMYNVVSSVVETLLINSNFGENQILANEGKTQSAPRRKAPSCPTIKTEFNNYNRP